MNNNRLNLIGNLFRLRISLAFAFLILLFIVGAEGYHLIEGMTFFDGFYQTFITITTIGFSELKPFSHEGRILTVLISIFGIGTIAYIASQTTQLIFENELFFKRALQKQIDKMDGHYIICGYGRIGRRIAQVLSDSGIEIVVIENQTDIINELKEGHIPYVDGNAQEEETLKKAGVGQAKGLVCTLSKDEDNVFVTLIARELNEKLFILVRTNQQKNTRKILRAGASKVISPYEIGADRMANVILRPNVELFVDRIVRYTEEEHYFDEIKVFEGSLLDGKTISEAGIRQNYNLVIIAIVPADTNKIIFNPGSSDRLNKGDILIVLGDMERINRLRTHGCGDKRTLAERVATYNYLEQIGLKTNFIKHSEPQSK
ncbi:MAG TPA: potassium channel protein [Balneolales bacterium]|nr:potassium channel protein [Balneolales bacterium]